MEDELEDAKMVGDGDMNGILPWLSYRCHTKPSWSPPFVISPSLFQPLP